MLNNVISKWFNTKTNLTKIEATVNQKILGILNEVGAEKGLTASEILSLGSFKGRTSLCFALNDLMAQGVIRVSHKVPCKFAGRVVSNYILARYKVGV